MEQAKIILTRIDVRLVHGQVGITWANAVGADTLVVIDDEAAQNPLACKLMESVAVAASKKIRFYTVDCFVETFFSTDSTQKLFLVVACPQTAKRLVEKGIPITVVNIGNQHYSKGKLPLNRKVYLDDLDLAAFNYLISQQIEVYYQDVPGTQIEKLGRLEKKKNMIVNKQGA